MYKQPETMVWANLVDILEVWEKSDIELSYFKHLLESVQILSTNHAYVFARNFNVLELNVLEFACLYMLVRLAFDAHTRKPTLRQFRYLYDMVWAHPDWLELANRGWPSMLDKNHGFAPKEYLATFYSVKKDTEDNMDRKEWEHSHEEATMPCFICKKPLRRGDADSKDPEKRWVVHNSIALPVHTKHKGVEEWYQELLKT